MSLQTIQNNIERTLNEIASLQNQVSQEINKLSNETRHLEQIERALKSASSLSALTSKTQEAARVQKRIADINKKQADLAKKIGDKQQTLARYRGDLAREQAQQLKKQQDDQKRQQAAEKKLVEDQKRHQSDMQNSLNSLARQARALKQSAEDAQAEIPSYDVFISHASEDKADLVDPLFKELEKRNYKIWYDNTELKVGDRLRRSIDTGLANSRFGIVVISPDFLNKGWPQYELDGLMARQMEGGKVILPIWHRITKTDLLKVAPSLVDMIALRSADLTVEEMAEKLAAVLGEPTPS